MVGNFSLQTIDLVTPSAINAYPSTVYESLNELSSGRKVLSLAEAVREDKDASYI